MLTGTLLMMGAFRPARRTRGYALLISLGLLGILGATATLFVRVAAMEATVATAYVDKVRARMLADAGLERASSDLRQMEQRQAWSDPRDAWTYRELYTPAEFPALGLPRTYGTSPKMLEDATFVSWYDPSRVKNARGYSGALAGTYDPDGDVYALKVIDCASQLNVNNFDLPAAGAAPAHPGNPNLFKMLNVLGAQLGEPTLGNLIQSQVIARRAAGGSGEFGTKLELVTVFNGDHARFNRIRDFVTCASWIDPSVVAFTKLGARGAGGGGSAMRRAGGGPPPAPTSAPHWDSKPRAPININTCSKEVLVATLVGLACEWVGPDHTNAAFPTRTVPAIPLALATKIADFLIAQRYQFGEAPDIGKYTYYDWMHFRFTVLDALVGAVSGVTKPMADMIHANANPNTTIKKLNPDLIASDANPMVGRDQVTDIDKADLAVPAWSGTTEWCFGSMGYYEIEAVGRVYREGRVLAEEKLTSVVRLHDLYRATTQKDFETDRYYTHPAFGSLMSQNGYPAVISTPEYPFATGGGYRWKGADRSGPSDPATDPYCASWDGALCLSPMVRTVAGTNPGRKSFLAGYGKGTIEPDQSTYGRSGEPTYGTPLTRVQPSVFFGDANRSFGWYSGGGGGPSLQPNEGMTWGRFDYDNGSDLHPMGLYVNTHKRNALRTYYGDEVPVPEGTIEMFVKPEVDCGLWGRTKADTLNYQGYFPPTPIQTDGRMHLLDWGTATTNIGGGDPGVVHNELRVFTTKGRIFAHWRFDTGQDLVLWHDIAWSAHSWHHIEVNFTKSSTVTEVAPNGKKSQKVIPGQFMFFVDGNASNPGSLPLPRDITRKGPHGNEPTTAQFGSNDAWFILGGVNYNWPSMFSMGASDFVGTIDNVFMHKWRLHDRSFIPRSRYLDNSVAELVDTGLDNNETVGVYMKRLTEVEKAATARGELTLGTISCTHVHAWHVHATTGHTSGKGHLSPMIMVKRGGNTQLLHQYDACSGLGLVSQNDPGKNQTVRAGDEVYYVASFERRNDLPALTSPILDDFTLTYMASPTFLYRVSEPIAD